MQFFKKKVNIQIHPDGKVECEPYVRLVARFTNRAGTRVVMSSQLFKENDPEGLRMEIARKFREDAFAAERLTTPADDRFDNPSGFPRGDGPG